MAQDPAQDSTHLPQDDFIWLEDIYGEKPLEWVKEQNRRTEDKLVDGQFTALEAGILEVLDSEDRIPVVTKRGCVLLQLLAGQGQPPRPAPAHHWESYLTDSPAWEIAAGCGCPGRGRGHRVGLRRLRLPPAGRRRAATGGPCCGSPPTAATPCGCGSSTSRTAPSSTRRGFDIPVAKSYVSWLDQDRSCWAPTSAPAR